MGNVIKLTPDTAPSAGQVLSEAQAEGLTDVVIVGWDKDGNMYFKTSYEDGPNVLWLLEQAADALLAGVREQ